MLRRPWLRYILCVPSVLDVLSVLFEEILNCRKRGRRRLPAASFGFPTSDRSKLRQRGHLRTGAKATKSACPHWKYSINMQWTKPATKRSRTTN